MPRSPHSVGVSAIGDEGVCAFMALIMFGAFAGSGAMGTTGVPQSLPAEQSAVLSCPYGNVPSPMSMPFDRGSLTNWVMALVEFFQLSGLAGGGNPVTILPD